MRRGLDPLAVDEEHDGDASAVERLGVADEGGPSGPRACPHGIEPISCVVSQSGGKEGGGEAQQPGPPAEDGDKRQERAENRRRSPGEMGAQGDGSGERDRGAVGHGTVGLC